MRVWRIVTKNTYEGGTRGLNQHPDIYNPPNVYEDIAGFTRDHYCGLPFPPTTWHAAYADLCVFTLDIPNNEILFSNSGLQVAFKLESAHMLGVSHY